MGDGEVSGEGGRRGMTVGGAWVSGVKQDVIEKPTMACPPGIVDVPFWQRREPKPVLACPCLVKGSAEGEDVEGRGSQAIGGHVAFGAGELDGGTGFAHGAVVGEDPLTVPEQDVGGLDVAVIQAAGVKAFQGPGERQSLGHDFVGGNGT